MKSSMAWTARHIALVSASNESQNPPRRILYSCPSIGLLLIFTLLLSLLLVVLQVVFANVMRMINGKLTAACDQFDSETDKPAFVGERQGAM